MNQSEEIELLMRKGFSSGKELTPDINEEQS
jgi:hypothetical protein